MHKRIASGPRTVAARDCHASGVRVQPGWDVPAVESRFPPSSAGLPARPKVPLTITCTVGQRSATHRDGQVYDGSRSADPPYESTNLPDRSPRPDLTGYVNCSRKIALQQVD